MFRVLVINPGSTSTKLAVYHDDDCVRKENVSHTIPLEISRDMPAQLELRLADIRAFLAANEMKITDFDMVAARCGFIPYSEARAYRVNQLMMDVLAYAPTRVHASNLGALIGSRLTEGTDIQVVCPDGPSTDEMLPEAKVSGLKEIRFSPGGHVLNCKQVSRVVSARQGKKLADTSYIVAHMGGGSTVAALRGGRIHDILCTDRGPMSAERSGSLPVTDLIHLCYSGICRTESEMVAYCANRGGLLSHTGTNSALELEQRALAGDGEAIRVFNAMAYQVSKAVGEMYVVLGCRADAVILTGAMAHSDYITGLIADRVGALAPIEKVPGELEMEGLAGAALRALRGEEPLSEYELVPPEFGTEEAFYAFVAEEKARA